MKNLPSLSLFCQSCLPNFHRGGGGGDIIGIYHADYPSCPVNSTATLALIGDGTCHTNFNIDECGHDDGDCTELNNQYPECAALAAKFGLHETMDLERIGDGICDGGVYNTEACGFEGGDCEDACDVSTHAYYLADGYCQGFSNYNTRECGYDHGDCLEFNAKYPDCHVKLPEKIGDGTCDEKFNGGVYFTKECGYDGGDCWKPVPGYPECHTNHPEWVGDGVCNPHLARPECGHDGGDCTIQIDFFGSPPTPRSSASSTVEDINGVSPTWTITASLFLILSTMVVQAYAWS